MATYTLIQTYAWDAGARTIDYLVKDGEFTFSVGHGIGVCCGLNSDNTGESYTEIRFGFLIEASKYQIVESGIVKKTVTEEPTGRVFKISRSNSVIRYYVDDELIYTSETLCGDLLFGDCSLYAFLDDVLNATIVNTTENNEGAIAIGPITGVGIAAVKERPSFGQIEFGPVVAEGEDHPVNQGAVALGPVTSAGAEGEASWGQTELGPVSATGRVAEQIIGVIELGPVTGRGIVSDKGPNFGQAELGPVTVTGEDYPVSRGSVALGPLISVGADDTASWGQAEIGPARAYGLDSLITPEYSTGVAGINPLSASGQTFDEDCYGTAALSPLAARGGEGDVVVGAVVLSDTLRAFGYTLVREYLIAEWPAFSVSMREVPTLYGACTLGWPEVTLAATGTRYGVVSIAATLPYWDVTAYGGGHGTLTAPELGLTGVAVGSWFATAELDWPEWTLTGAAQVGGVGSASDLEWEQSTAQSQGGAVASATLGSFTLAVTGVAGILGQAENTVPYFAQTAEGLVGGWGEIQAIGATFQARATGFLGAVGSGGGVFPVFELVAYLSESGATPALETTYAVNLTSGAVTQLVLGAFEKLVVAHGRLYGLRSGSLLYLGGDDDQGTDIAMTVRFAPQQFGVYQAKRLNGAVYLNTRESDGVTLYLIQDETTAWKYQTATDTAPAMGTHRVKVGRGITFHSLGLTIENRGGGRLDVGGIELPVYPLSRRPV